MTVLVQDILSQAASSKERMSPVDMVMGDHWAEVKLGNSMRLSLLGLMLKKQQQLGGQSDRGGSPALRNVSFQVVRRGPQAMVKVIRKGGTTNARGMRDQMTYLEKDGDAKLERSERYFGAELDDETQEKLIEAWGLAGESKTNSDKTTHFVVSFPSKTDHDAAYRAGRAWADEMFASGSYGDVFDYYTAFHTDKAHPHIHIIVNRRGLENGDWLKVSRRSQFNYDEFRAVQVEVSLCEGIFLEASPRHARGISDRPIPDAEIRTAKRENREAQSPTHTAVTALRAAASVVLYAEHFEAHSKIVRENHPVLATAMNSVAATIREGREIVTDPGAEPIITSAEAKQQSEFIMSRRSEILDGIQTIDTELGTVPAGPERNNLERDASRIKAEVAQLIPDVQELRQHSSINSSGYYQGMIAEDATELEVKSRADQEVGELAESIGIDPAKFVSRYDSPEAVSQGLSDSWRKDELEDIQKNLTYQQTPQQDQAQQLAQTAYDDLHRNALQTYRKAERDLDAHAARKKELYRIAKLVKEGSKLDGDVDESFRKSVKDTFHTSEFRDLENGKTEAFRHVTKDVDAQRALSRRYLEAELEEADGARKLQLTTALTKIDRDTDLAAQQSAKQARKDRGLDR
ncbi:MAG: relaxase/mobilization nuclease domain-containing protein [Rhodothermales bacterium]